MQSRRKIHPIAILSAGLLFSALTACNLSMADVTYEPPAPDFLPAFPGAQGFGARTTGGRFGRVLFVTNLNDSTDINSPDYPGSLRWAVESTWPDDPADPYDQGRIILFKVGGTIEMQAELILSRPYMTIAGQTAPGCGIALKGQGLVIATHDVILRGVRVRIGGEGEPSCCRDGIRITTSHAESDVYNIILDHNSVSWAVDENLSLWSDVSSPFSIHDVTVQWNFISEGLNNSIHIDEGASEPDPHSMGLVAGEQVANVTIHHNLFAHNSARNPRLSGVTMAEVVNNLIYDWERGPLEISGDPNLAHLVNNYFKPGTDSREADILLNGGILAESRIYQAGNLSEYEGLGEARLSNPDDFDFSSKLQFETSYLYIYPTRKAYTQVLKYAGAITPRDAVDERLIPEVHQGTGGIIDSQEQVGGWPVCSGGPAPRDRDADGLPDAWEAAHGLDPADPQDASSPDFLSPAGYTWIEEYVNGLIPRLEDVLP
jgi:pectate lyase